MLRKLSSTRSTTPAVPDVSNARGGYVARVAAWLSIEQGARA